MEPKRVGDKYYFDRHAIQQEAMLSGQQVYARMAARECSMGDIKRMSNNRLYWVDTRTAEVR